MKEVSFFVGPAYAELYIETSEKLYAYRAYKDTGEILPFVNCAQVEIMPTTPKTKRLNAALTRVKEWMVEIQITPSPEKQKLYYKIQDHLT